MQERLDSMIRQIRSGVRPQQKDLITCLCAETLYDRCHVNYQLAQVFWEVMDFDAAAVCIKRAWTLSDFSSEFEHLYLQIHTALKEVQSIKSVYKRRGLRCAQNIDIDGAIASFNNWQYAAAHHLHLDAYEYDDDILQSVQRLAAPYAINLPRRRVPEGGKIRLAYLVFGAIQTNSCLVKINRIMAKYHNKSRFDVTYYIPDSREDICCSPQGLEHLRAFTSAGCKVELPPEGLSRKDRLLYIASRIAENGTDILVTSALLADFDHYFIAATRPASLVVGLLQGPPPQFAASLLDWSLAWTPHPLMDSPCGGTLVPLESELPDRSGITPISRGGLGLPEGGEILMSLGRPEKFQCFDYWRSVLDILKQRHGAWYVAVGVTEDQLPFIDRLKNLPEWQRVKILGWRTDCQSIMCLADILIDTFPSGGGIVIIDAMALSIPIVSFENNYLQCFDQTNWSVMDWFADIPELAVRRYDFEGMKAAVLKLLNDKEYRAQMAQKYRSEIFQRHGEPGKCVRACEDVYYNLMMCQ